MRVLSRRLLLALLSLLALLVLLLALLILIGQQPEGAHWLLRDLIPLADSASKNSPLRVTQIEGRFPQNITLLGLSLHDEQGVWLSAERVTLHWSPWALLTGELQLKKVLADGVKVMRLPQPQKPAPPAEAGLPQLPNLPFVIQLDQLAVKNLQLAKPLLGQAVVLEVRSQLLMAGEAFQAHLSVVRQDLRGEAYQLVLNWQRNVGLQGDLTLVSPEGGLLSALIQPSAPEVRLHLKGRGPLSEWQAELQAAVAGLGELEGGIRADLRLPQQLKVQLSARPGTDLPEPYQDFLGERLALELDVAYDWQSPLVLRQFELQTAVADLSVRGVLSPQLQLSKTDLLLNLKQPKLLTPWLAGVAVQQGVLKAQLSGALAEPHIEAQVRLKNLVLDKLAAFPTLWLKAEADLANLDSIKLQLQSAEVNFASTELQALLSGELVLSLEAALKEQQWTLDKFRFTSSALTVTGAGESKLDSQQSRISLRATVHDIAPLAVALKVPAEGHLHLDLHGHLEGQHYRFSMAAELQKLRLSEQSLQQLLGSEVKLQLESRGNLAGELRLTQLQLRAAELNVQASGVLRENQALAFKVDLQLDDLQPLATELSGAALLSAELGGSLQRPSLNLNLKTEQLRWQQHQFDALQSQLTFSNLLGKGRGKLLLKSGGSLGEISLRSDLQRSAKGDLALSQLRLKAADLTLLGGVKLPASGLPLVGKLQLKMPSMALLKLILGAESNLQGAAELDLALSAKGEKQNVQLSLRATQLQSGLLQAGDLSLEVHGRGDQYDLDVRLLGKLPGRLELELSSRLDLNDSQPSVQLKSLQGWLAEQKLSLLRPTKITLGDNLGWKKLSLGLGEGRLDSVLQMQAEALNLSVEIQQLPLATVRLLLPEQAWSGEMDGQLSLQGRAKNPQAELKLSLSGLQLEDSPEFAAELNATWRKGKVQLNAQLQEARGNPLVLSASLPVKASGERHLPQLEEEQALQMNLDWQGNIEPLWTLLPLPEHRLQGEATMALALRGSFVKPLWQGEIALRDGEYENLTYGTLLKKVTLQATLQEAKRLQLMLSAEDGEGGTVQLSGPLGLFDAEKTALNIVVKDALLLRNDGLRLQADADLNFVDQVEGYLLSGRAEAKSALLNLAQQLPPSVVDLKVIELDDEALPLEAGNASVAASRVKLDLKVDMPRRVYLRGRGLESEWGGSLKVKGDTTQPRLSGRLQVLNGDFVFVGRQFDFERGSIEFYGSDEIDPQLDFLLSYPSASMNTQFLLSGLASKPTLTLSSDDPNLPEDEVLSKMLFDKGSTDLSPLEVLELTQAVAELSGLLSGGGGGVSLDSILGALRQAFGFDVLRIRAGDGEGEGATVDVGKYLSDSVYVGVRQGAQPEASEVTVEIEITPDVKFESRVGEANENRSSLSWEWDY